MALIKCSECEKEISDTSKRCIHCGAKVNKKSSKKGLIIAIFSFLTIIVLSICAILITKYLNKADIDQSNERDNSVLQVEIITDYINIRQENNTDAEILGKVYNGEIYTVIEKSEDGYWYLIETNNGICGYIYKGNDEYVYLEELDIFSNNDDSNIEEDIKDSVVDKNENNKNEDSNNHNNTTNNSENESSNIVNKPNVDQTIDNNVQNNIVQDKEEPKLPACLITCEDGYELKDANSVNCYCEKKEETYITKNQIIYDNDGVIITVKGLDYSNKSWVVLDLHITNNSNVAKTIQKNNFPYVNGYDIATNYSVTLLPGTSSTHGMTFLNKYLEKNGSTIIKTIKLDFVIIDWDGSYETLHGAKKVKTPWIDLSF